MIWTCDRRVATYCLIQTWLQVHFWCIWNDLNIRPSPYQDDALTYCATYAYMVLLARIELALKPYHGLVMTFILKEHLYGGPNLIRTDILGVKVRYTNRLCYRAIWLQILDLNQWSSGYEPDENSTSLICDIWRWQLGLNQCILSDLTV